MEGNKQMGIKRWGSTDGKRHMGFNRWSSANENEQMGDYRQFRMNNCRRADEDKRMEKNM